MNMQHKIGCCFTGFILCLLISPRCVAQDEAAVRMLMEPADQRKLEKADRIRKEADRRMDEVNTIYAEIRSIRQDSTLKKRAMKTRSSVLEDKSWQKQVQASTLYEKSNGRTYAIYKKYLNRFWREHEGEEQVFLTAKIQEEQARDNFDQASLFRRKSKHMNLGIPKIDRLTEANHLEAASIKRQITSLATCYEISAEQPVAADTVKPTVPAVAQVTPQSRDTIRVPEMAEPETVETKPVLEEAKPVTMEAKPVTEEVKPLPEPVKQAPAATVPEQAADRVVFRIQIAASRAPLTFDDLARMYTTDFPVEVVSEGGWLKYQTIGVPLYADAQRVLREINAKGSFVVAYRKGIKQSLPEMISLSRELEKRIQTGGRKGVVEDVEYHLELAASKTALQKAEIARLYSGPEPVLLIMDRGMFKYHLYAGYSLQSADNRKRETGMARAGIVAYRNGKTAE